MKYSDAYLKKITKKYKRRSDFRKDYPNEYSYMRYHEILDEYLGHLPACVHSKKTYTKKQAIEMVKALDNRSDIYSKHASLVRFLKEKGWFEEVISFRPKRISTPAKQYTFDDLVKLKEKFPSRLKLNKGDVTAWRFAKREGWLDKLYPKISDLSYEEILERVRGVRTKNELQKKHPRIYQIVKEKGFREKLYRELFE